MRLVTRTQCGWDTAEKASCRSRDTLVDVALNAVDAIDVRGSLVVGIGVQKATPRAMSGARGNDPVEKIGCAGNIASANGPSRDELENFSCSPPCFSRGFAHRVWRRCRCQRMWSPADCGSGTTGDGDPTNSRARGSGPDFIRHCNEGSAAPAARRATASQPSGDTVWIPGYWTSRDGQQQWVPGHWDVPPRTGATWVAPRWEQRGDGYVFVPGYWQ